MSAKSLVSGQNKQKVLKRQYCFSLVQGLVQILTLQVLEKGGGGEGLSVVSLVGSLFFRWLLYSQNAKLKN
jgi:hypothetical protein